MNPTVPPIRPLSRAEVRSVDQRAIDEFGMTGLVLMENAGRGAAHWIHQRYPRARILILCGLGNNGGDGLVIARHLDLLGHALTVVMVSPKSGTMTADAWANLSILRKAGFVIEEVTEGDEVFLPQRWQEADVILDALLGTGARGNPRPPVATLIEQANAASGVRIAIDIPSGLDCDLGIAGKPCFQAKHTLTFVAPKVGFAIADGPAHTGEIQVVDIGVPRALLEVVMTPPLIREETP